MTVLRENGDRLRVAGDGLLQGVPHFLNVDALLLLGGVQRERHLPAQEVTGNEAVASGLQPEHERTVRIQSGHQAVLHIHGVVALDVLLGAVPDLVRGAVGVAAQALVVRAEQLLVHHEGLFNQTLKRLREHGLTGADLRVKARHEGLHTATGDHG